VRVVVTVTAIDGAFREVDMPHGYLHVRWLVAIRAVHSPMRPD
jgi:hypothetical protein